MRRVVFISRTIRLGKTISVRSRSRPSQMDRAAWPTSMMKGMGKGLRAVRSVRTKPGADGSDLHPGPGEVDAQRLQEVDLGGLGRSVGFCASQPAVAGYGGDAGYGLAPSLQHRGQDRRDGVAHAGEVDLDVAVQDVGVPGRRVHLLPVARGQHREVDRAQLLPDSCCSGRDGGGVVTSAGRASMFPPATSWSCSLRRAEIATVAPRRRSSRATAAPIPLDPPTTQATFPARFMLSPWSAGAG